MEMKLYVLNFNTELYKFEAKVVNIQYKNKEEEYQKLTNIVEGEGLDIVDYNEDIAILVDDRGFFKKGNPVYILTTEEGVKIELSGKLIFIRNVYNEFSTDFGSITYQDICHIRRLLNIRLIGIVK